jgi:hypothetical protein
MADASRLGTSQSMWSTMATKRKRNESVDMTYSDEALQPAKKSLAFRSPPKFKPHPIFTQQAYSRPFVASFLTPVDSDDDLPFSSLEGLDSDSRHRSDSNNSSDSSSTSIHAVDGDNDKMNIFLSPPRESSGSPWSPRQPLGRPRSNGMLQPIQSLHKMSTQAASLSERAPTPIHQRFPDHDIEMSDSFQSRTILSPIPMLNGDLPSPGEEADQMMSDLSFTNDTRELSSSAPTTTIDNHAGRQARLHMGYRADCDKCRQHVPGHYTHILWS